MEPTQCRCTVHLSTQYSESTVGPLSSVTCAPMFMQFTGCHQPVQGFYWPENAIDWLRQCSNNMRNAKCAGTQTSMERPYCSFLYCASLTTELYGGS